MTSNNRENATWGAFGCEADETDADPLSKFQQQAMLLNNGKSRLRTTRSVGGNVGSVVGRKVVVNKFDANPLSKLQQQAMLLTNENSSLRSTRRVGGNVGRTVGSGNKTDVNPLSKIQQQAMPLKNENSSLRTTPSVGGNLGSIVGREVINKTETNPLSKFQQQAMPLSSEKGSLRTIRSVGGNLGSIFGRDAVETDANPLSKFQQQAMPLSREKGSLRTIRSVSGNLGSIFGREFDETDANPLSKFQQQAMPLNNEKGSLRGIRSIGGNLGSIFGREVEKTDANPLSEFQQQSLSVFESEHMWAHFKAHLAERNIQTTAGVRAMLPEFVNDRVLDGSVRSERPVYPSSMRRQESFGTRSISSVGTSSIDLDHQIYPSAMRRQESFGMNTVLYGQPKTRSVSSSTYRRTPSGSSYQSSDLDIIDAYNQAIRGDTDNVLSLYGSENENDVSLLTTVSKRLSKMTSSADMDAPKRFSSTVARSNSVFSTWSTSNDIRSSNNSGPSNAQSPLKRPKADSIGSGKSRPKFRRPSTSDEDIPELTGTDFNTPRRPSESSWRSDSLSEMAGLLDDVLLVAQDQIERLDAIKSADCAAGSYKIDTFRPNSFSYQPQRNKGDRKENPQVHVEPVFDEDSNTETTNDSFAYKNEVGCKDAPKDPCVPPSTSLDTGHTLLVEWGEGDSASEDEDDGELPDSSEHAVVIDRGDLVCNSHEEEENSCRIPAAQSRARPNLKRGMMALISSLTSEKSRSSR